MTRRARRLCGVLLACVVIAIASWLAGSWYVRTTVLPDLWARYGLTMVAERQDLSITGGTVDARGVRFLDGDEEVLTAKRMELQISLGGLYRGRTIVERLALDDPILHARIEADGDLNVRKILERPKRTSGEKRPAALWGDVRIHRGTVALDDRARGAKVRIVEIEALGLDIQTGGGEAHERFGQIRIDAKLEQPKSEPAPLAIVHWTTSSIDAKPTFVAHAAWTGIDLDSFPAYVDAAHRESLGVDHLDLIASMDVREGNIRRGAVVATSPERERALTLRFGGRLADPVFDRSSRLRALWDLPFARLGHVGDIAWEAGGAVADGAVGTIDGLVRGDPVGAGAAAVEGVDGGVRAFASNALDAVADVGRALGLVAKEEPRDARALHARRRALLLAAQREAAQTRASGHE